MRMLEEEHEETERRLSIFLLTSRLFNDILNTVFDLVSLISLIFLFYLLYFLISGIRIGCVF